MKLLELVKFDSSHFFTEDCELLIGVDEVGRGSLAGPVVCAAFSSEQLYKIKKRTRKFPLSESYPALNKLDDSKRVKIKDRAALVNSLKDNLAGTFYALAEKPANYIDENGIVKAIFDSMSEAIAKIITQFYKANEKYPKSILILVDGPKVIPDLENFLNNYFTEEPQSSNKSVTKDTWEAEQRNIKQVAIKKGDSLSAAIAAASNIAKDYRDKAMKNLVKQSPEFEVYHWQTNVGYGSLAHRQAIQKYKLSIHHRRSFCKSIIPEQA